MNKPTHYCKVFDNCKASDGLMAMLRYVVVFLCVITASSTFAEGSSQTVLGVRGEESSSIGLYLKDIRSGKTVFEHKADKALVPASITKALTSASAMTLLGEKFRYRTEVELRAKKAQATGDYYGAIVIKASGDPTLDSRHFDDNGGFCDSIVAALQRRGVTSLTGTVQIENGMPQQGQVETWEIEDTPWPYGAGIYSLNFKDNVMKVFPANGKTEPHQPGFQVVRSYGRGASMSRGAGSSVLTVRSAKRNFSKSSWSMNTTMTDPQSVLIHELIEKMRDAGITFNEKAVEYTFKPRVKLYTRQSPKLADILRSLMVRSDNMFAEGILRAFAPGKSREEALASELSLWDGRGVSTKSINIVDGSGLSRGDSFSPRFLGDVLEWMVRSKYANDYLALFPLAGVNGTVKSLAAETRFAGRLAVKSGSMNGVQCYAGYVLGWDLKPTHVVVIMCNQIRCSRESLRNAIVAWLDKCIPAGDAGTFSNINAQTTITADREDDED